MIPKLIPFLAVIAALALFFGYVKPEFGGTIATLKQEIETDNRALDSAQQFKAQEAQLTQQRNAIPPENLARIEAYVPTNVDTVHVVIDLNALAARSGVLLSNFAVASKSTTSGPSTTSSAGFQSVDLTFEAAGTYNAFRSFLDGLENSLPAYDVTHVNVKSSSTGVYTYTLTVRTYELQ